MIDWAGRAAFVLAFGIALSLVGVVGAAAFNGRALAPEETTAISTIFGATVGAVATYLGGRVAYNRAQRDDGTDQQSEGIDEQ
jgi:membrane protein implicated in regulation of membrane protease activity